MLTCSRPNVQTTYINRGISTAYRFNQHSFHELFAIDTERGDDFIVKIDDFLDSLKSAVENYYNIKTVAVQRFVYTSDPPPAVKMTIDFHEDYSDEERVFFLTESEPYGPMDGYYNSSTLPEYIDKIKTIKLELCVKSVDYEDIDGVDTDWIVYITYDNQQSYLNQDFYFEEKRSFLPFGLYSAITAFVIASSGFSLLFNFYIIVVSFKVRRRTIQRFESIPTRTLHDAFLRHEVNAVKTWGELPHRVRMDFMNPWIVYSVIGDVFLLLPCMSSLYFFNSTPGTDVERLLFGSGVFVAATRMTTFLLNFPSLYMLMYTVRFCASKMVQYLVSVTPVFIGFMLSAEILFSPYAASFKDAPTSAITLWALVNGDEMMGIYSELEEAYWTAVIPRTFITSYTVIFIAAVFNVFIFIIEDSYHLAKLFAERKKFSNEEIPGVYQLRFEGEWEALKRLIESELLFDILDEEAPSVHTLTDSSYPLVHASDLLDLDEYAADDSLGPKLGGLLDSEDASAAETGVLPHQRPHANPTRHSLVKMYRESVNVLLDELSERLDKLEESTGQS